MGITSSKLRGHDVDDEENRRPIVIAFKLHSDAIEQAAATAADVTPGGVAFARSQLR